MTKQAVRASRLRPTPGAYHVVRLARMVLMTKVGACQTLLPALRTHVGAAAPTATSARVPKLEYGFQAKSVGVCVCFGY
jgi:hypothetical protein